MQAQAPSLRARWDALAGAIVAHRDVLDARIQDETLPAPLVARGWADALLALSEDELVALEIAGCDGTPPSWFPHTLVELHASTAELCNVPALEGAPAPSSRGLRRLETPRKRVQVDALSRLILPLAHDAARVVEVGSGHGHLAREVAERIERPVIGLERNGAISARARGLASSGRLSFVDVDVLSSGLDLKEGDCALGLHACGELGDAMVVGVAERARSLVLVGCCLQKMRAEVRLPLDADRPRSREVALPRSLLGLSNFTPREQGVEATRAENVTARERRLALHALLSAAVGPMRIGAEMDGLNRRAAHGELYAMVTRAHELRGLPVPPKQAAEDAQRAAKVLHGRIRRLSLPRVLLGRVLEMFIFIDRALHLESAGFEVRIGTAFPKEVSARNLTLLARRR